MDEESDQVAYKDGDVVWVKLRRQWWPGEVKDLGNVPQEIVQDLKKASLAIVKFFQEDSYEYVNNPDHIHLYNCDKKNDFIKKGMDAFRNKTPNMDKFPKDVMAAEVLTDGNPNILSDPIFAPEKKFTYEDVVFGTSHRKSSSNKDSPGGRGRKSTSKTKKSRINITHRRFLGFSDYQSHVRIQFTGKDKEDNPYSSDEDLKDSKPEETKKFTCTICKFTTDCLEVMVLHNTSHIQGVYMPVNTSKKSRKSLGGKKYKKPPVQKKKTKKPVEDDDSGLNDDTDTSEDLEIKNTPKLKRKSKEQPAAKPAKVIKTKPKTSTEIQYDLLAEWEDFSDAEETHTNNSSSFDTSLDESNALNRNREPDEEKRRDRTPETPDLSCKNEESPEKSDDAAKKTDKSCFDFDEDDDLNDGSLNSASKVTGRKIPRVIPLVDKRKSTEVEEEDETKSTEDEEKEVKADETKPTEGEEEEEVKAVETKPTEEGEAEVKEGETAAETDDLTANFAELLAQTAVPQLPDVPDSLKCEQNFHGAKTIKFPDKPEDEETGGKLGASPPKQAEVTATKLTNPKKRFVKSFEDFEQRIAASKTEENNQKLEETSNTEATIAKDPEVVAVTNESEDVSTDVSTPETSESTHSISKVSLDDSTTNETASRAEDDIIEDALELGLGSSRSNPVLDEIFDYDDKSGSNTSDETLEKISDNINQTKNAAVSKEQADVSAKGSDSNSCKIVEEMLTNDHHEESPKEAPKEEINIEAPKEEPAKNEESNMEAPREETAKKEESNIEAARKEESNMEAPKEEPTKKEESDKEVPKKEEVVVKIPITNPKSPEFKVRTPEFKANILEIKMGPQEDNKSPALKLTSLKSQIMTKLNDETFSKAHQSPRSKILETYRNECGKEDPPPQGNSCKNIGEEDATKFFAEEEISTDVSRLETVVTKPMIVSANNDVLSGEENVTAEVSDLKTAAPINDSSTSSSVLESKSNSFVSGEVSKVPKMPEINESDLVPIDGNLTTVVSEKDLADGQVEITTAKKNPVTLTNFSMDFSDGMEPSSNENAKTIIKFEDSKKPSLPAVKTNNFVSTDCDLEEHIPPQIVRASSAIKRTDSSKLFGNLAEGRKDNKLGAKSGTKPSPPQKKFIVKSTAVKSGVVLSKQTNKKPPVMIKSPQVSPDPNVSVQKITSKRTYQDVEDIDTFIIQKPAKKVVTEYTAPITTTPAKTSGKAKILQQTIITPAGEIIQPEVVNKPQQQQEEDAAVFDINSMPIVLSDDILTPESIQNMPIVISDSIAAARPEKPKPVIVKKAAPQPPMKLLNKSIASPSIVATKTKTARIVQPQKIVQGAAGRVYKPQLVSPSTSSPKGKFMVVPQNQAEGAANSKGAIIAKKQPVKRAASQASLVSEPIGNKIMLVTTPQGEQQRLLLTPAQQKMLAQGAKYGKVIKSNVIQKSVLASKSPSVHQPARTGVSFSRSLTSYSQTVASSSQLQTTGKNIKIDMKTGKAVGRTGALPGAAAKTNAPQKTILFKDQYGQILRKLQGTDDALLEKQVAEQIEAIKASGMKAQQRQQEMLSLRQQPLNKAQPKRSYAKKPAPDVGITKVVKAQETSKVVPPLAPISPKKPAETESASATTVETAKASDQRPLNQLVIQDSMGNQTTITEGQILALPSETVDGQPQSYMLVTLDETGNLTPLNSEALMSLDPNLSLGGDLSNMVYQIDQGTLTATPQQDNTDNIPVKPPTTTEQPVANVRTTLPNTNLKSVETTTTASSSLESESGAVQPITCSVSSDPSQQLIVTGDPIATQKFLESLSEGTTDLANILANAEGSSILIHADGQQILINTEAHDNQNLLLSVNSGEGLAGSEGGGNPIFATQPPKNKDILAAALAGTDVFQQEGGAHVSKAAQSQLSPNSALYPMNVGNVLETSLTLSSPIMTPLEVPSNNNKKIPDDEADILTQVPKNVDLPITITDPNISHTVAQQQVASLIANELPGNLELTLPISDASISVASTEMSSPAFVYSLPTLDDSIDLSQKSFNSSMPLLTEDDIKTDSLPEKPHESKDSELSVPEASFMEEEEGLCTLGGEMCTSLSEPPPDMFEIQSDYGAVKPRLPGIERVEKREGLIETVKEEIVGIKERTSPNIMNDDSCEIPVLPPIVTDLSKEVADKLIGEAPEEKNCKFND